MEIKKIFRAPVGNQERLMISTTHTKTNHIRKNLELCKELYINAVDFSNVDFDELKSCAISCEEVGIDGMFEDTDILERYEYAVKKALTTEQSRWKKIVLSDKHLTPEKTRKEIYDALLDGAIGIQYDSIYDVAINRERESLFNYIKEINYRVKEIGRTLIALDKVDIKRMSDSLILEEIDLPFGCSVSEFVDSQGERYLMIQNQDYSEKTKKLFELKLKKKFRVYRVNPHDGKQVIMKDGIDTLKILVMPGDADLLRFQDINEDAYLIDYVLKK